LELLTHRAAGDGVLVGVTAYDALVGHGGERVGGAKRRRGPRGEGAGEGNELEAIQLSGQGGGRSQRPVVGARAKSGRSRG
jgi:hypothetical protein